MKLRKVISGGQTGADQTGVEEASLLGLETGGTMPKGFKTDVGPARAWALKYGLVEHPEESYVPRTRLNAKNSDVTVWFGKTDSPGYYCTKKACKDWGKDMIENPVSLKEVSEKYEVVNIAGNRESKNPGVITLVRNAFRLLNGKFCLCTPDNECDFHKRGGYTTKADEVADV